MQKEYFQDALSGNTGEAVEDYQKRTNRSVQSEVPSLTLGEVLMAVESLNNNRSGVNGIPAEFYNHGAIRLLQHIHGTVMDACERELIPAEWEEGIMRPINKKGDHLRCENYIGIALLNTVYKIFSKILNERLRPKIEAVLGIRLDFRKEKAQWTKYIPYDKYWKE
jgi:hypothetical protein